MTFDPIKSKFSLSIYHIKVYLLTSKMVLVRHHRVKGGSSYAQLNKDGSPDFWEKIDFLSTCILEAIQHTELKTGMDK